MAVIRPMIVSNIKRMVIGRLYKRLPLIAGHKLLYSCNLRCKMCPFWRRKDEKLLTLEEEVLMLKNLEKAGVIFMGFEGGEPLLRRDLPQILEESYKMFYTSLVTNGWLLKDKIKEISDFIDYLFVSLDGIGETHDKLRGVSGSFDRAIEGIKKAREMGIRTAISFTITNENLDQVDEVVRLVEKLGVVLSVQVAYDYSTAEKLSPSREKLKGVLERLLEYKRSGKPIIQSQMYFKALLNAWYYNSPWECKPWLTINIDPQGRIVLPCYVLNEYSGDKRVWEVDLIELWNEYPWHQYSSCNKCGLSCYIEPSLFSWKNYVMVKERILEPMLSYLTSF